MPPPASERAAEAPASRAAGAASGGPSVTIPSLFDVTDETDASPAPPRQPAAQQHVTLAKRLEGSLAVLDAALRRNSSDGTMQTVGFVVGSRPHGRVLAALEEVEAVRKALLELR